MTEENAKKEVKGVQVNVDTSKKPGAKTLGSVFRKAVLTVAIGFTGVFYTGCTAPLKSGAVNDTAVSAKELVVGAKMPDGTIFAGISPDTKQPMYAAPADAPMSMDLNAAARYAKGLEVGGKKGFRVPSKAELNVLFKNRKKGALKGTFNLTGSYPAGWYWSSTLVGSSGVWQQRFSDGSQDVYYIGRDRNASVRCVRYNS